MIAHGRKQISEMVYARKAQEGGGAVRLTNMIRGGAVVFGGLKPSFKSPYSAAATRAIKQDYPAYWPAIQQYGFDNPEVVPLVNQYAVEDAGIALSLCGIPRYLVSPTASPWPHIETGLYFSTGRTEVNIDGCYQVVNTECALFGNLQTNNGNWYGINSNGTFWMRCIQSSVYSTVTAQANKLYKHEGVFDNTCTYKVKDEDGTQIVSLSMSRSSTSMGSNSIWLFGDNFGGSVSRPSRFMMARAEIIQGTTHRLWYPFIRNNVNGLLDILTGTFYSPVGGTFSISTP